MDRKDAIRSAYRMTESNNFYDGMMTCSTLSGKAVCRLVWAMNKADCEKYPDAAEEVPARQRQRHRLFGGQRREIAQGQPQGHRGRPLHGASPASGSTRTAAAGSASPRKTNKIIISPRLRGFELHPIC